jgi:hypothetical protein
VVVEPVVEVALVGGRVVEVDGVADGRPGVVKLVAAPPVVVVVGVPTVEPGVPSVDSEPLGMPIDEVDPADDVDDVPPRFGVSCVIVGLRSVGTLGRGALAAGRARTRSPSGIPCSRAWLLCERGPASRNNIAAASTAR